jgi:Flp pilus assembly protein TadG
LLASNAFTLSAIIIGLFRNGWHHPAIRGALIMSLGLIQRFWRDRAGNFAQFTAILAVPLFAAVAIAVDTGRSVNVRSAIQNAADTAALAAAALPANISDKQALDVVRAFFSGNGAVAEMVRRTEVSLTDRTTYVEVRATADVDNTFAAFGATDSTVVEVMARAGKVTTGSEVAIAIDLTNSMNFGMSWPNVADAVGTMLQDMKAQAPASNFRVSLVPFNDRVNLGEWALDWLDAEFKATLNCPPGRTPRFAGAKDGDDDDGTGRHGKLVCVPSQAPANGLAAASAYPALREWQGCLEPREEVIGGVKHALDDSSPVDENFVPTIPGTEGPVLLATHSKCPAKVVLPTSNIASVESAISGLAPAGGTGRFDEALAWGWRLVSPNWRGRFGDPDRPADMGATRKTVMLFTDAHTTANEHEMGRTKSNLGFNNGSTQMFDIVVDLCGRMKESGVTVLVFHVLGNEKAVPYLQECASVDQYFGVRNRADFIAAARKAVVGMDGTPRLIH